MNQLLVAAIFVSIWDGGIEIKSKCNFNMETKDVTDIEVMDVNGLDILEEQFVRLPDGREIKDFTIEGVSPQADETSDLTPDEIIKLKNIVTDDLLADTKADENQG